MKTLATTCLLLSLFVTGYSFLERELPYSQYTKVLSDLKTAGINDQELIQRVRWSIIGVRTTWPPLLVAAILQNALLVILLAKTPTYRPLKTRRSTLSTQL